ncbi:MAG: hypothetical protein K2H09_04500 [Treponemataceae bacterium]|nr:hypothetical protein [Treponemataceae bacterium]
MDLLEELLAEGADIAEGLRRLGGKADFYTKMLLRVPTLIAERPVTAAMMRDNPALAVENAHAVKGVAGNLSITPLYESYSKIVALLREGDSGAASAVLEGILPVQERILSIIEKYRQLNGS